MKNSWKFMFSSSSFHISPWQRRAKISFQFLRDLLDDFIHFADGLSSFIPHTTFDYRFRSGASLFINFQLISIVFLRSFEQTFARVNFYKGKNYLLGAADNEKALHSNDWWNFVRFFIILCRNENMRTMKSARIESKSFIDWNSHFKATKFVIRSILWDLHLQRMVLNQF